MSRECYYDENNTLIINKKILQAVLAWTSDDPSRPTLNALRVESDRLVAIDGYAVMVFCNVVRSNGEFEPYSVDAIWLRQELRSTTMKVVGLRLSDLSGAVHLERRHPKVPQKIEGEFTALPSQENFPPYKEVIPAFIEDGNACRKLCLNPALIVRLDKLVTAIGASGVRFQMGDNPIDPLRFDLGIGQWRAFGAIMPMRDSSVDVLIPSKEK